MTDERVNPEKAEFLAELETTLAHDHARAPTPAGPVEATSDEIDDLVAGHDVVFVNACTPRANPCRMFGPVFEETARAVAPRALFLMVDLGKHKGLSHRYEINEVPTLLAFRHGRLIDQRAGAMPPAMLRAYVSAVLDGEGSPS